MKSTTALHHPVDLVGLRINLEAVRGKLVEQEEAFFRNSLGDRLKIGLFCYKAHCHFAVMPADRKGVGGRGKKNSLTREGVSFSSWLAAEVPWLKEATAYKYMSAFRGLGLDELATEQMVDDVLADQRRIAAANELPEPTLQSLVKACAALLAPPADPPQPPEQIEFAFLKERASAFRQETEALLAHAAEFKALPEIHKAICARAYNTLYVLTGVWWGPSDQPDHELAHIDPDTIAL